MTSWEETECGWMWYPDELVIRDGLMEIIKCSNLLVLRGSVLSQYFKMSTFCMITT